MNAQSSNPVRQHAETIRQRGVFQEVLTHFWKEQPPIAGVLDAIQAPTVYVVPFFLSKGYFTEQLVPRELGLRQPGEESFARVQHKGLSCVHYGEPVGTHSRISSIIRTRIDEVLQSSSADAPNPAEISLFLAAHGTERDARSRAAADKQAQLLSESGQFAAVQSVFLEEDPQISSCYTLTRSANMVVVPFFLSEGLHTAEDLPELLGESPQTIKERLRTGSPTWRNPTERYGKRVWLTNAVGTAPGMVEVILDRVRQMVLDSALEESR